VPTQRLQKKLDQFQVNSARHAERLVRRDIANQTEAYPQPIIRAATMDDVMLKAGERGLILGMTREGKSTLGEVNIDFWYENYKNADILIMDSKPRFRAQWQLNGLPASPLYRNWDHGTLVPHSVVIPLRDAKSELRLARQLGYRIIIAQIHRRSDIRLLDDALTAAYENKPKGRDLFIYVDEMNNYFRNGLRAGNGIIMAITSGGEKHVGLLGAAQRPRNISVESLESMTACYWFYTPFLEDVKHLKSMDVPQTAHPPATRSRAFYLFNRVTMKQGLCRIKPVSMPPKAKNNQKGWVNYG
jgi:hypothetical protein